jgi:NAD(P)-dependent dehydrogenase (short-subunit alcohol dehydrogenase family)
VRRTYETNVFGVIATTNAFLPLLRRSPHGRVVNVSSELGSITGMADPEWEWSFLHLLAYQSSKAAQNAVTLLYAKELRTAGITVNAVNPGLRDTDMAPEGTPSLGDVAEGAAIITTIALGGPDSPTGQFYEERRVPVPLVNPLVNHAVRDRNLLERSQHSGAAHMSGAGLKATRRHDPATVPAERGSRPSAPRLPVAAGRVFAWR